MSAFLQFSDVSFRYLDEEGAEILNHASLTIKKGKVTVIAGGSGCGKSTLALLATGIYPAAGGSFSGEITLLGDSVGTLSVQERTRRLTILFQNPDLQFCMDTLRKEMIFCLENLSAPPASMDETIRIFAEQYGVAELLDQKFHTLSGGEKQKAALCCLLLLGSEGIILDEPFANLDPESAGMLLKLLVKAADSGVTLIAIDHKLDYWLGAADEIMVLGEGGQVLAGQILPGEIEDYRALFEREGLFFPAGKPKLSLREGAEKPALTIHNLTIKCPGRPLLTAACASFPRGSITALLGLSGSGKTSLFTAILGQKNYEGSILLGGKEVSRTPKKQLYKQVCAVFQNPANQFVTVNVLSELIYSLRLWRPELNREQLQTEALMRLKEYGLERYIHFSPYMLSQGQQRRLAVCAMLAGPQRLLLLDEPTYGQDKKNTDVIMTHLKELAARGLTVIFSTHDRETAAACSDYIYEIREEKIVPWNG